MTRNDDIERVLHQWFTEGPRHMPDRLFDGTFERIERLPKRRFADLHVRLSAMNLNVRLAAAAALIIALAGAGLVVLNGIPGVGSHPSPTPATYVESALPTSLRSSWRSVGTRIVPDFNQPVDQTLLMTANGIKMSTWKQDAISSAVVVGDRLIVRLQSGLGADSASETSGERCRAGAQGTYAWSLTPGGVRLSLRLISDECPANAAMLAGDWIRDACPDGSFCIGNLEADTYTSWRFQPFQFDYSVPAGWVNPHDDSVSFTLRPASAPAGDGVYLFSTIWPDAQAEGCAKGILPEESPGARKLAAWLGSLPGLTTSSPVPLTLGGLDGVRLDVSLAEGWTQSCPGENGVPIVNTFTRDPGDDVTFRVAVRGAAHATYILLDYVGQQGQVLGTILIDIEGSTTSRYAEILAAAEPVVASFRFTNDSKAAK